MRRTYVENSITYCVCLYNITPCDYVAIGEFGTKKYFRAHRKVNISQLQVSKFAATKGNFSGLIFFWTSHSEGEFSRD